MNLIVKPMLAPQEVPTIFDFPVLASPKLDGIRCLRINNKTLSRTFKEIPNQHIQATMANLAFDGLDGELMSLNPDGSTREFNQIQGDVMRESGTPNFRYYVFDYVTTSLTEMYADRMVKLETLKLPDFCIKVLPTLCLNMDDLNKFEEKCLSEGYEGIMVRSPKGPYKCGRATLNQGWLLKVKRFMDSEAIVIGFEELLRNENEAEEDAFGRTKRSKAQDGLVPAGTLGKFLVQEVGNTPWNGQKFAIGTGKGLTLELRQKIWDNREQYITQIVTYSYQPHGVLNLPRLPIWKGFRDSRDL